MKKLLIVGAGFAGMWSALSAARAASLSGRSNELDVTVLAPEARLNVRPRFYESDLSGVSAPLNDLFEAVGVTFVAGYAEQVDAADSRVVYRNASGERASMSYDRLVLATGSRLAKPNIPGLDAHTFNNDTLAAAQDLQRHLDGLVDLPDTPARNTVVVAGGGFTGIETAAEMPARLRQILGSDAQVNVIIVERAEVIGPDMGMGPRPVIEEALHELGITLRLGAGVAEIDERGVRLADGSRIDSATVIWTAGLEASPLTQQIDAKRDRQGRLHVTPELRVVGQERIFAAGDTAFAATDDAGNHALMSCQHAMNLGRSAGHNAAADLLGIPTIPYDQVNYVTCLDLGPWGAVLTEGWDRKVKLSGAQAKELKRQINTAWIYPPRADRNEAFLAADPTRRLV
ncbi:FAD-dependent oxidoreductase [Caballeronia sp. LZ025]|uniref:NAD(P)/FAD-dependent oxidoreductase n=1 Tax=Caballeronia TaxID=1827195 RepID=UPI001FD4F92E|nr:MULTISPECIES: FAD-dependent oxidoreductase [Caballeronia]MDR5735819.1 FAD-dependent oxidoreductase [Caballeronia sp. LZ025]